MALVGLAIQFGLIYLEIAFLVFFLRKFKWVEDNRPEWFNEELGYEVIVWWIIVCVLLCTGLAFSYIIWSVYDHDSMRGSDFKLHGLVNSYMSIPRTNILEATFFVFPILMVDVLWMYFQLVISITFWPAWIPILLSWWLLYNQLGIDTRAKVIQFIEFVGEVTKSDERRLRELEEIEKHWWTPGNEKRDYIKQLTKERGWSPVDGKREWNR